MLILLGITRASGPIRSDSSKLDGDRLTLTTERNKSPIDGSEGFGVLEFERIE